MKLWNFIKSNMKRNPLQQICEGERVISFEEAILQAEALAQKLKKAKCCAILCESEMSSAIALLSCFAAGVTAVPLSVRYGELYCNKIIDSISPDVIITDENGINVTIKRDSNYIKPRCRPAIIMCTSGTTGKPKGVMLSEKNIIANVKGVSYYFMIERKDTILISRSLYHCAVLSGEFLTALIKGSKIRFYSKSFNPAKILEIIKKDRVTVFCGTPTWLSVLASFNIKYNATSLKHICISGECMNKNTAEKIINAFPNCNIYSVYGLTEAGPRVSFLPPSEFSENMDCVGLPLKSTRLKIVDKNGKKLKENMQGVLWVKSKSIMKGYYLEPQKTKSVKKRGWLCTGDIAEINSNGYLKIKGRSDNLIIKSGMNIYPAEIEEALNKDDRVKEVIAFGVQSKAGEQIGIKIAGNFNSVNEVKKLCNDCLPLFQVPSYIEIVSELKKSAVGKIIRENT